MAPVNLIVSLQLIESVDSQYSNQNIFLKRTLILYEHLERKKDWLWNRILLQPGYWIVSYTHCVVLVLEVIIPCVQNKAPQIFHCCYSIKISSSRNHKSVEANNLEYVSGWDLVERGVYPDNLNIVLNTTSARHFGLSAHAATWGENEMAENFFLLHYELLLVKN